MLALWQHVVSTQRYLTAQVKAVDGDAGTWTAVASAPSIDRDDEVLEARCFDPLPDQVPVRDAHFGGQLVGSGQPRYKGEKLLIEGRFASTPRAQEVRALVVEGHLNTMSVVFLPKSDRQVDGRRHITAAELLAIDWAEIPSNRDSRVLAVRDLRQRQSPDPKLEAVKAQIALLELDVASLPPAKATPTVSLARLRSELNDAQRFLDHLNDER